MFEGTLNPVSNRADWFIDFELVNDDTGETVIDLDDIVFNFQVRSAPSQGRTGRYPLNYYYGVYGDSGGQTMLVAQSGDSHITTDNGVIEVHFTAQEMSRLTQGAYEVGLTATRNYIVEQELIATLPVIDGIVRP